jgi:class 3 adenylate cyclase
MPLFMDVHSDLQGATLEAIEKLHLSDREAEARHGVRFVSYWFNEKAGTVFCLLEAPSKEACNAVHLDSHGEVADAVIEVEAGGVDAFLGGGTTTPLDAVLFPDGTLDGGMRTILFTDIEGSTTITQRLGDDAAMALLRTHNSIVRAALANQGGREVKHTGDGFMASFASTSRAVSCAVEIQREFRAHNERQPPTPIRVRIGITAGEPVTEGPDLFGAAVQLARRICDSAQPTQVLVSGVVRDLCIGKVHKFVDRGAVRLKGFEESVHLYEVSW